MNLLTVAEVSANRGCLSRAVQLPGGEQAQLRLLEPADGESFGRFLGGLSEATRNLYAPHPLTLDQGRLMCADLDYPAISGSTDPVTLRFVGVILQGQPAGADSQPQDAASGDPPVASAAREPTGCRQRQDVAIAAYFILLLGVGEPTVARYRGHGVALDPDSTCTFAPVVADAYQDKGVGSALVPGVFDAARRLGFTTCVLMGGTRAINHRAIRYYEKAGFRKVGDFDTQTQDGTTLGNHDMVLEF